MGGCVTSAASSKTKDCPRTASTSNNSSGQRVEQGVEPMQAAPEESSARPRKPCKAKFGEVLGYGPGGVPAFSSHYKSASLEEYPDRRSYRAYSGRTYTGLKYQCVEYARRWLVEVRGVTFGSVHMAHEIFEIGCVSGVLDGLSYPVRSVRNGAVVDCRDPSSTANARPVLGSLLIWEEVGYFKKTGHVAVVTQATDTYVRVAEQNVEDRYWVEGRDYARELAVEYDPGRGTYTIHESCYPGSGSEVLGWVNI